MIGYSKKNVIALGIIATLEYSFSSKIICEKIVDDFIAKFQNVTIQKKSVIFWIQNGNHAASIFVKRDKKTAEKLFWRLHKALHSKNKTAEQINVIIQDIFEKVYPFETAEPII